MLQLKRNTLSVALASAILAVATGAQAQSVDQAAQTGEQAAQQDPVQLAQNQTADDERATQLDVITVTGIRAGIENAIDTKRDATSIVESVSAEDIGKLPDVSIAESIARLPGLTAQRVAGRASTVSIRGLADDFATTLLNGREQVSVGHNRGVEFDQYPSELLSGVVVYKTPDASLVGQGLAGTVDLRTVRPLDFPEATGAINFRGEHNSLGPLNPGYTAYGYRFSASYIDQFADNTLGVAIGYARLDSPGQAERWEAWGYPSDNADAPGSYLLGGSKSQSSSTDNVRDGLMAVIEYKPNDFYSSIVDIYYSKFEKSETLRFMETGLAWGAGTTLSNPVIEGGAVVSGTFSGVRPVLRNDRNTQDDDIFAIGWRNEFQFNDNWTGVADLSFSKAEREEMILETYSGLGHASNPDATDTVDFVIDRSTGLPRFTYGEDYTDPSNLVLTDPGGYGQDGFIKLPSVEDELKSLRLDLERSFEQGMFSSLELGVNHADREKTRSSGFEGFLRLLGGQEVPIPSNLLTSPADLSFTGIPGSIGYDIDGILALYQFDELIHQDVRNKNWTVEEKVTTAYAQLNIDTEWGSVPVRGNVGVQAVRTDQSSSGFLVPFSEADAPLPISGGAKYEDYLPSLNLAFEFPHEQMLRFALARQIAKPRLDWLRANQNVSIRTDRVPGGEWEGNGGNPELKPWEANAADLSYEKYFGGRGYVSLAGFYKDLRTWVTEQTVPFDFTGYDPGDRPLPPSPIGGFTTPVNGEGGKLYGWEFALSMPFDLLWQPLDGFGLIASYSDTTSSIEDPVTGAERAIAGLSEEVYNITLYYEKHGFSTRVSQRHRSPFLGEVQGFGGDRSPRFINSESIVDLQIGYAFAEGSFLDGLSVLLQVNNLTNEPYREYFPEFADLPRIHNEYGRTVLMGLNYRF